MSLTGSLFSGISGLNTLGNAMTVIGDNIANISTVGFKASRVTFQDILSQTVATAAGTAQVGRGTSLSDISSSFAQGSFESTNSTTDLAIGGQGFFIVRDPSNENNEFYTRAGEFRFDKDGNFTNPSGYIVRGWALDPNSGEELGSVGDIRVSTFTSPPSETTTLNTIVNLDSRAESRSDTLSNEWDGSLPLGENLPVNAYAYQTTLKVYDSLGTTHDLAVYFDRGDTAANGNPLWEFIVTSNPLEDQRNVPDALKGLLARGELEFDAATGGIQNIRMWESADGATWNESVPDAGGYLSVSSEFILGNPMSLSMNFGARWDGNEWLSDSLTTTQYAAPSRTVFQTTDGHGAGDLQSVTVAPGGVITGLYSNGQVTPLFRVALANFQNVQGLYKEGGNLFRETRLSGDPIVGRPGSSGLGSLSSNSLELSNVDLATEFVKMITTQRGYQANTKVINVTDQMLQELISLKR